LNGEGARPGGAAIGQAEGLDLGRVWRVLQALRQTLADLPTLDGWQETGWRILLRVDSMGFPGGVELRTFVQLARPNGILYTAEYATSDVVFYAEGEAASVDDVVLTTLSQADEAVQYLQGYAGFADFPDDAPSFLEAVDNVGPDTLLGLLGWALVAL